MKKSALLFLPLILSLSMASAVQAREMTDTQINQIRFGKPVVEEINDDELPPSEYMQISEWAMIRRGFLPSRTSAWNFPERRYQLDPSGVLIGVQIGTVVLNELVNLGKSIWDVVKSGQPTVDISMDVASAVPKGITDWTMMESWQTPISKLYKVALMSDEDTSLGDFYFRLMFTPGGKFQGHGNYLANVTIVPAQLVVPYRRAFVAQASVTGLVNHGTSADPLAGILMTMQWGVSTTFHSSTQSVSFDVKADGVVTKYPDDNEEAETILAKPRPAPRTRP